MGKKQSKSQKAGKKSNKRNLYAFSALALVLLLITAAIYLFNKPVINDSQSEGDKFMEAKNPVATIEMENGNKIIIELEPKYAPNTVNNFIDLANNGFYDGLLFHLVIPGFMIQGGCPQGSGMGNPGYSIKGEFLANDHQNPINHERGVISMARSQHPDSAGSQFFIMVSAAGHLDGQYAAFGKVLEGMDEVDHIVQAQRDQNDRPLEEQIIRKITVDTFGVEYNLPEKK